MNETVYLKNREPVEEREIDPDTQCEIIVKPRKRRVAYNGYSGLMRKVLMFSAMFGGMNDLWSPNLHVKRSSCNNKGGEYYISLSRKDQKLPYETKQDLKRLKMYLKQMDNLTIYETIIRYKFR